MALVRFAARDPGGANVLAAILTTVPPRPFIETDVWALPKAAKVFDRSGLRPRVFSEDFTGEALASAWANEPPAALVTGTSHQKPFEVGLWDIAKATGIPSIAILDQWQNVERRFRNGRPDYVGAIDSEQAEELLSLGFNHSNVVVVGHPWLARVKTLHNLVSPVSAEEQGKVRILFVSEGIAGDVASGQNDPFGFDEFDSFDVVYRSACRAVSQGLRVVLAVKFHPYEEPDDFRRLFASLDAPAGLELRCLDAGVEPHPWVEWSDLVVGISSMLLLEAMVLQRPVVSVQPRLKRENTFIAGRHGYVSTVTDPAEGESLLTEYLLSPVKRRQAVARQRPFVDAVAGHGCAVVSRWLDAILHCEQPRGPVTSY
jgi:hypothetical protein